MCIFNSLINKPKNKITTGLICRLYLNKDKSKSINIQVYEQTTCKEIYEKFKEVIEGNITMIDKEIQEYKFILKDKQNNNNLFILKNNFFLFDYLINENERYELFYLPCNKRKPYTISMALKDKNSYQHVEANKEIEYNSVNVQVVKEDVAFKFSKKMNQFVKINIYLHTDVLILDKIKSNKSEIIVPLSSISDIKKAYDKSYGYGFSTMLITSKYSSSKTKNYYIAFENSSFNTWFSFINNYFHLFTDNFSFNKICQNLNELNRKKTGLLIQLVNKFSNIKGVLSLDFSKKIFYDFYENQKIKEIYDLFILYESNIMKKEFFNAHENIKRIINILKENKEVNIEFDKNKNVLEILGQYVDNFEKNNNNEKENENMNDNNNEINDKKDTIKLDLGFYYKIIDNIIAKFFEPRFNEIMNSELKISFLNKIMKFVLEGQNKDDNIFLDINLN